VNIAAFGLSVIAILIACGSLIFTARADRRAKRAERRAEVADERAVRAERRDEEAAAARRRGIPIVTATGGSSGSTADPIVHSYDVRNGRQTVITELRLWIEDSEGEPVSTGAGGPMALAPSDPPAELSVNASHPGRAGQTLMVQWRDEDGEHTELTGIHPPHH
jgi:hypothetical protein